MKSAIGTVVAASLAFAVAACSSVAGDLAPDASPGVSTSSSGGGAASSSGGSGGGSTSGSSSGAGSGYEAGAQDASGSGPGNDGAAEGGDDATPGDDAGSAGDAAFAGDGPPTVTGMPHVAVLYDPSNMNGVADLPRMLAILMAMPGLVVEKTDDHVRAPMLASKQLIIIMGEASTFGGVVDPAIRDLPVPVILSKDAFATTLQMGNDQATSADQNSIVIVNANHPLAAGLPAGRVQVFPGTGAGDRIIGVSGLGPDAITVATTALSATQWSIYAYPKGGTMMNAFKAPAKRVGFFWHRPPDVTDDGAKLFEAAVTWALQP